MIRSSIVLLLLMFAAAVRAEPAGLRILVVVGSGGTGEYTREFAETAALWTEAARKGEAGIEIIGLDPPADGGPDDAELLKTALASEKAPELWLVLIGHGTFDQREAKFNLRGPDLTDRELAALLDAYPGEQCVVHTASASGSLVREAGRPGRIVVTSTKNEAELSYSRFAKPFAIAIGGLQEADLDNDEQVSLLEAFLYASAKVGEFYQSEGRIATEHAQLDDNGDQLGSRAEWYEGTTPVRAPAPEAKPDGDRAAQKVLVRNARERQLSPEHRRRRDELERQVVELRRARATLDETLYYGQLETLLLDLARIYAAAREGEPDAP